MAEKIQIQEVEERLLENLRKDNSVVGLSEPEIRHTTHELIEPQNRVHGPYPTKPHEFTRTIHPIQDTNPHPLPPHEFTTSRLRQKNEQVPVARKGESKVEWIPYQKKIIQFKDEKRTQKKPVVKKVQEFREQIRYEQVPREELGLDYYAVEKVKKYVPRQKIEKQYVTVQKMVPYKKTVYVPRTRQVYHGPNPNGHLPVYNDGDRLCGGGHIDINRPINHFNAPLHQNAPIYRSESPQPIINNPSNFHHSTRNVPTIHSSRQSPQKYPQPYRIPQRTYAQPQPHLQSVPVGYQQKGMISNNSMSLMQKYSKQHHSFCNDSYQSYVPSFRY